MTELQSLVVQCHRRKQEIINFSNTITEGCVYCYYTGGKVFMISRAQRGPTLNCENIRFSKNLNSETFDKELRSVLEVY